jgi:hypothetical protein
MACSAAPLTSPGTGSLLALGCCRFAGGHQLLARLAKLTAQEVEHLPLGDLKLGGDRAREVWEASFEDSDHLRGEAVHLAGDIGSNHPLAVAGQLFHFLLASQDFVLLELLGLDPGVDGLGVLVIGGGRRRCASDTQRMVIADGLDDIHARRLGVNAVKLGVQAVEAATLVDRAPLFELRLGDIDVDRGRPAPRRRWCRRSGPR